MTRTNTPSKAKTLNKKGLIPAAINLACQVLLWGGLIRDVLRGHWGLGLWAIIAPGLTMVIVTMHNQLATVKKERARGEAWVARFTLGVIVVSFIGNVASLVVMGIAGVRFEKYDLWLIAIAAISTVILIWGTRVFPGVGARRWIILSICTRGEVQIVAAGIAISLGREPIGLLPLLAFITIALTLLKNGSRQHKNHPDSKTRANLYLFRFNVAGAGAMSLALITATLLH